MLKTISENNIQAFKYFIIGGICASLDFTLFSFLIKFLKFDYILSNCISVNLGIITSYVLNTKYNFKVNIYCKRRFFSFYAVAFLGLVISYLILIITIEFLKINEYTSKIFTIVIVAATQYLLNKNITFKAKIDEN